MNRIIKLLTINLFILPLLPLNAMGPGRQPQPRGNAPQLPPRPALVQPLLDTILRNLPIYEKNLQTFERWVTQNCNKQQRDEIAHLLTKAYKYIADIRSTKQEPGAIRLSEELNKIRAELSQWKKGIQNASSTAAPEQQIECPICLDNKNKSECVRLSCGHTDCKDCLLDMMQKTAQDNTIPLTCPDPTCKKEIHPNDWKAITNNKELLTKLDARTLRDWVNKNIKKIAACPTKDCPFFVDKDEAYPQAITCLGCNNVFCSGCGQQHSPRTISCQEYKEMHDTPNDTEKATKAWMERYTKPCPNCKRIIQRQKGCNYMICSQCGYTFCWRCSGHAVDHQCVNHCDIWDESPFDPNKAQQNQATQHILPQMGAIATQQQADNVLGALQQAPLGHYIPFDMLRALLQYAHNINDGQFSLFQMVTQLRNIFINNPVALATINNLLTHDLGVTNILIYTNQVVFNLGAEPILG